MERLEESIMALGAHRKVLAESVLKKPEAFQCERGLKKFAEAAGVDAETGLYLDISLEHAERMVGEIEHGIEWAVAQFESADFLDSQPLFTNPLNALRYIQRVLISLSTQQNILKEQNKADPKIALLQKLIDRYGELEKKCKIYARPTAPHIMKGNAYLLRQHERRQAVRQVGENMHSEWMAGMNTYVLEIAKRQYALRDNLSNDAKLSI